MADEVIGLNDTQGLIGKPMDVFNSLGPDIQGWIVWILGLLALIFFIVTVLSFFGHGISGNISSIQRDTTSRNNHIMGIISGIITVFLVVLAVAFVFAIYF